MVHRGGSETGSPFAPSLEQIRLASGLWLNCHTTLRLRFDKRNATLLSKYKGTPIMPESRIDLPQGTLDLLVLRTLALGPLHGWAISERIHQVSSKVLQVHQGSLYPALHRLERRGWIKAHWGASENNRRAKYYELTKIGRKQLEAEESEWKKLTSAVAQILETA
jgi:PadR family transcriptional regulator, regulatory protein PadR